MSTFKISGPGSGSNGFAKPDHVNHLFCFVGATGEERNGANGPYQVANCATVVCATCHEAWVDVDMTGNALVPKILSADGEIVAGVLHLGQAKAGQNAPFLIDEPSPEEIEDLDAVFAKFGARLPSGKVVFDVPSYNESA